ncbi:MAG: TetR/AcrR family transcriptional regulator [Acidiferrobacteraceae bacterium]
MRKAPSHRRRKRLSATDRRRLILQGAIELFSERGFRATRVKDVAERVGTSDALVFQHFPTKRELYDALLDELCSRRHFTDIEHTLYYEPEYDLEEVLTRLSIWVLEESEREPAWLRLILYAALEHDDTAPRLLQEHFQRIVDYVAYEIGEGQREGRFRPQDPARVSRIFVAGLIGLGVVRAVAGDPHYRDDSIKDLASTHVQVLLQGLRTGSCATGGGSPHSDICAPPGHPKRGKQEN